MVSPRNYWTDQELLADWKYWTYRATLNQGRAQNAALERARASWSFLTYRWGLVKYSDFDIGVMAMVEGRDARYSRV